MARRRTVNRPSRKSAKSAKPAKPAAAEPAKLWFHPQRGALITQHPFAPEVMRYRGGQGADWREVMRIRMGPGAHGYDEPLPGQKLPKGFLFGDPTKQSFGMGGPQLVFGPLEKVCRDCKEPFVFPATSQKQLLEEDGAFIDTTAVRCLPCARRRSKIESARRAHAVALDALAEGAPAGSYLAAGRAALALLEAGGSLKLDRAISHCRKAQKLGARSAAGIEAKLIELRAARQLESKS